MQKVQIGSNNFVENVLFKHPFGKKIKGKQLDTRIMAKNVLYNN